jgi:tetratricopeptide (TPR) repeat protein
MVQAPQKIKTRRARANLTLILTFSIVIVMLVLVGVFFRVGQQPKDSPKTLSTAAQHKVNHLFWKTDLLRKQHKLSEAVVYGQQLIDLLEKEKPDDWMILTMACVAQSDMLRGLGQWEKAATLLKRAREIVEAHHLEEQPLTCEIVLREGIIKFVNKEYLESEELFQQALSCTTIMNGYLSRESSEALLWIAENCLTPAINKPQKAMQYLRAVEEVCNSAQPERPQQMMLCLKVEGRAFLMMKKFTEAEEKLLAAQEIAQRIFPDPKNNEREHITALLKEVRDGKAQAP